MNLKLVFLLFIISCTCTFAQDGGKFKVVLDAGHGGKDFGALYHGYVEKNITLNVALKVGKLLEQDNAIQVLYTRKTDVFVALSERPDMANRADANLFISIHCNGEPKKAAFGTETFIMGPTKNASNLEVAKKENSVIKLEKDKEKYEGFDPNKPEALLSAVPDATLNNSIDLASKIQDGFTSTLKRKNRGVKYAPFWILNKASMPGVVIELGFVSYEQEGAFLNSEDGQDDMAKAIAKAIQSYKKEYYTGGGTEYKEPAANSGTATVRIVAETKPAEKPETKPEAKPAVAAAKGVTFKVQISASGKSLETVPENFKGLTNISKDASAAVIKYYYGATDSYDEAKQLLVTAKEKGYTSAFVVAFKDGKKITVQEALGKK
ncbi:N-acetylmuramoyl-L-alanine amidase [Flavobacterium rivuli WB 3.3-2 = DSM 21788]|uniref:N-acetylmuramoyl-L-alanine amidase n=2 Tax=Flavobacterium rivuli TaxID=498301 RepID=A0A0A2MAL9_9FLAO|nr:N-acetylmuramoyl-L-alanine amidase [Flavobacterium rivuli]KGO88513.1 N-acetylmuramoyl-L-alanine amidase [Flavobacterium rivuli WB 3.3-2 = DSM 21788]